jgi:uncharacterized protein
MHAIVYLHGFLSSPLSQKAQQTAEWLAEHHPMIKFCCPSLSAYPGEAQIQLVALINALHDHYGDPLCDKVGLIGSSLGGFWATWLAEKYKLRAVLINPACEPQKLVTSLLDQPLKSYHSDRIYTLLPHHVDEIDALDVPITDTEKYWLLAQMGDEVLDYRVAEKKYALCKKTIEQGGDHSFQGYEEKLKNMFEFLTFAKS